MFFQLSLPSTSPATEAAGDSVLPELDGAGTLTVGAQERPARDQVARLLAGRGRDSRESVRCRVMPAGAAAITFTACAAPGRPDDPGLQ